MAARTGGADDLRAAADDLELIAAARAASEAADEHLTETIRAVRDRRRVTVEQIADTLGMSRRGVYARLGR